VGGFVVDGAEHPDNRVAALGVVEAFDPFEDRGGEFGVC
jgi:hypothetical protein